MKRDIIVIGASAGGVDALRTILSGLPKGFPAALFVTVHTAPTGGGYLADALATASTLSVGLARDNEEIRPGHVYVAAPNLHLIVRRGYVRNRFLPKENSTRPAIDPMFRSAAHAYARRVIGVVLTGNLDDGTAGLGVVQDEGGVTIVQDPDDASHPDMPLSAIQNVGPDYVVPLAEIAPLLIELVNVDVVGEVPMEEMETNATPEVVTCPGCGGVLRQYADGRVVWYECQVGHRFTSETMILEQNAFVEERLWRILSLLKEKETVARTMASDARASSRSQVDPEYFEAQAQAAVEAQERLTEMIEELGPRLFPATVPQTSPTEEKGDDGDGDRQPI